MQIKIVNSSELYQNRDNITERIFTKKVEEIKKIILSKEFVKITQTKIDEIYNLIDEVKQLARNNRQLKKIDELNILLWNAQGE
jgi:Asp-tRNA(Asn)/Glu-tRNA(Gln) amidotransferase C subunit